MCPTTAQRFDEVSLDACINARRHRKWWTYWRDLPGSGTTQFEQNGGTLRLVSVLKDLRCVTVSTFGESATVSDPTATSSPYDVSNGLLRALRHLAAYRFATDRIRVQRVGEYPLHIGCDLDAAVAAVARANVGTPTHFPLLALSPSRLY
jgi:hypothetical protein